MSSRVPTPDPIAPLKDALDGRYEIERELGRGAFATVFLARDLRHDRRVAIKVLTVDASSEVPEQRFLREIRLLARLQHPNILPLHDSGHVADLLYYVMPYVTGESLRDRLRRERQLPVADAVCIAREIADALAYAHRNGVIHRDVKPENILLSGAHPILADFGVARTLEPAGRNALTRSGLGGPGTPAYMSPEQLLGESPLDNRSDIYSLGCVLFEMLAGEAPFAGREGFARRFTESPPSLSRSRRDVPESVAHAVAKALARNPDDRFQAASDFAQAIALPADRPETPHPLVGGGARVAAPAGATPAAAIRREHADVPPLAAVAAARNGALAPAPPSRGEPGAVVDRSPRAPRSRRRVITSLLLGAVAVGAVAAFAIMRRPVGAGLDRDLLVVAPFDVLDPDPELRMWSEGFMDVLSRNLDGAGPLRTVAPVVVARRWGGHTDRESVGELGRSTGARLAVFGSLIAAGRDSVRATATLLDVGTGKVLAEFERRDLSNRLDRLTDSVTMSVLRELAERRPLRAVQHLPLGSATSYPALKAFLHGESQFRRSNWDSALVFYERAVAADSNFALAIRRIGTVRGWLHMSSDSLSQVYELKAGALNRGFSPRDSAMILADSLGAAAMVTDDPRIYWSLVRRMFATLEAAVRRYREDPEAWHALGEARYHYEADPAMMWTSTLDAFDHAIALDSAFAPAYVHPIELGFAVGGAPLALRYARPYLRLQPSGEFARGLRLAAALAEEGSASTAEARRLIAAASVDELYWAWSYTAHWPDTGEVAVHLARAMTASPRASLSEFGDSTAASRHLERILLARGHLRETAAMFRDPGLRDVDRRGYVMVALYGAVPRDTARVVTGRWLASRSIFRRYALPLWAAWGDTAMLHQFLRTEDSVARGPERPGAWQRVHYDTAVGRAYLALARHDTVDATRRFAALPDSLCPSCFYDRLRTAQLLAANGEYRRSLRLLGDPPPNRVTPLRMLIALERGRVLERMGNTRDAVTSYRFTAEMWRNADPEFRREVEEAERALARLGAPRGDVAALPLRR